MTRHFDKFSIEAGRAPHFAFGVHWDYRYYEIILPFFSIGVEV